MQSSHNKQNGREDLRKSEDHNGDGSSLLTAHPTLFSQLIISLLICGHLLTSRNLNLDGHAIIESSHGGEDIERTRIDGIGGSMKRRTGATAAVESSDDQSG
jgi:hypothetical protein